MDAHNKALKYSFDKALLVKCIYFSWNSIESSLLLLKHFINGLETVQTNKNSERYGSPYSQYYKKIFKEKFGEKEINEGYKALGMRFHGKDDLGWFNFLNHPYESRNHKFEIEFDEFYFFTIA